MIKLKQFCIGLILVFHLTLSALPNLVFMGPPGCGKGTLSAFLVKNYGYRQISIGDILRRHVRENTEIGKIKQQSRKEGRDIPDALALDIVTEPINECLKKNKPFIIDNFPRNLNSFILLIKFFNEKKLNFDNIWFIRFFIPDELSIERICSRRVCNNHQGVISYNLKTNPPKFSGICDSCGSKLTIRDTDNPIRTNQRLLRYKTEVFPFGDLAPLLGFQRFDIDAVDPINNLYAINNKIPLLYSKLKRADSIRKEAQHCANLLKAKL